MTQEENNKRRSEQLEKVKQQILKASNMLDAFYLVHDFKDAQKYVEVANHLERALIIFNTLY